LKPAIVLDSGPLGLLCNPHPHPQAVQTQNWLVACQAQGRRIIIPEIADYETRRELLRIQSAISLQSLESYIKQLEFLPITTAAMRLAAELWAIARQTGKPTGHDHALDGDVILAAQVNLIGVPAIIATANLNHLSRYSTADFWQNIVP
jgi:predicted nucleic acid-binding protein